MTFYAHSLENEPPTNWETMAEHEEAVEKLCREFMARIALTLRRQQGSYEGKKS